MFASREWLVSGELLVSDEVMAALVTALDVVEETDDPNRPALKDTAQVLRRFIDDLNHSLEETTSKG